MGPKLHDCPQVRLMSPILPNIPSLFIRLQSSLHYAKAIPMMYSAPLSSCQSRAHVPASMRSWFWIDTASCSSGRALEISLISTSHPQLHSLRSIMQRQDTTCKLLPVMQWLPYNFEGWLKACTFPDSTPAKASMATLIRAGLLAAKAILQAAASSAALPTVNASPPKASISASYLQ